MVDRELWWGIDLGGTKIEGVVAAPDAPTTPLARARLPTESVHGYQHVVQQIGRVVAELSLQSGEVPRRVGIGTPGTVDPLRGTLKNSNTLCLNGQPLPKDLSETLGVPVRISNDANCFALAEAVFGAGRGAEVVFGVILGTGVGGGLVVRGTVWDGAQGNGGEWGHNVLDAEGPACYCGKRGCVETVISGPALERFYHQQSGEARSLTDVVARARGGGDRYATATIDRLCSFFGKAISVVINIVDPSVIVLGGGVSNIEALYTNGCEAAKAHVFNDRFDTKIVKHCLGDSAGVFGAAALCAAREGAVKGSEVSR